MSSLLRLERKQKISSNAFRIRLFPLCSYSFGIEMINTFIHFRSSLENYTRFHTKMEKSVPVFRPKRPKILTLCGGTNLHGLYKRVPPHVQHTLTTAISFSCVSSKEIGFRCYLFLALALFLLSKLM